MLPRIALSYKLKGMDQLVWLRACCCWILPTLKGMEKNNMSGFKVFILEHYFIFKGYIFGVLIFK